MANVNKAICFMLMQEDSRLAGKITNAAGDRGGLTRFGLCAKWHPALVQAGFFDPLKMSYEAAFALAEQTYADEYARPLRLADLSSDAVACAVLSFAVNDGLGSAARLLRAALNKLGFALQVVASIPDASTFKAEQSCSEAKLIPALVAEQEAHYRRIVAADPSQEVNLRGWLNRAQQVLALVG